jgi:hypothetical protein
VPLPSECFTSRLRSAVLDVTNRCGNNYVVLYRHPGIDNCLARIINAGTTQLLLSQDMIKRVCVSARGATAPDSCSCAPGFEYTAVTRPRSDAGGFPSDSDGCPVEKNDPRLGKIKNGDHCSDRR